MHNLFKSVKVGKYTTKQDIGFKCPGIYRSFTYYRRFTYHRRGFKCSGIYRSFKYYRRFIYRRRFTYYGAMKFIKHAFLNSIR